MTNREKILKTNIYDLMMKVASKTDFCPIILFGDVCPERIDNDVDCRIPSDCKDCVQRWINEEVIE